MNFYNLKIGQLPLSQELKDACASYGIVTLDELLDMPVEELIAMPWLNMSMIEELKALIARYKSGMNNGDL